MPSLIQGRIVYARIPINDPQGRNPKSNRPFVVITNHDKIKARKTIRCVAITDELANTPIDHYVMLPDGPGRFKHGCSSGSGALCTWIEYIDKDDIDVGNGALVGKELYQIVEKANLLEPATQQDPG